MVSLEKRDNYLSHIFKIPKLREFYNFIIESKVNPIQLDETAIDKNFYNLIHAILKNDKDKFLKVYEVKSKSKPNKGSQLPFINDDFLVFVIIIGIVKFDLERDWIDRIISIRNRNVVTITFENLLSKNYFSKSNLSEVVLIFLKLIDLSQLNHDFINEVYKSITSKIGLFDNKNDFEVLCALVAYDFVIDMKESSSGSEIYFLKKFNNKFRLRIKIISWLTQAILFFGLIYFVLKLPDYNPKINEIIEQYSYAFQIFGVIGFTILGNQIPFIKNNIQRLIKKIFGYPKELN